MANISIRIRCEIYSQTAQRIFIMSLCHWWQPTKPTLGSSTWYLVYLTYCNTLYLYLYRLYHELEDVVVSSSCITPCIVVVDCPDDRTCHRLRRQPCTEHTSGRCGDCTYDYLELEGVCVTETGLYTC